jgi:hypothetical protein
MNREDHAVTLAQGDHLGAGLQARPLFGEDEFTAGKILARYR